MKINLKWLLLTSFILALIIVYYFRPKIIEGHKINNEWHKKPERDSDGVLHSHPYTWSTNQNNTGRREPVVTPDSDWVSQAYTDGYNCFKDGKETIKEKECRILGINCPETEPDIYCNSDSDPNCNATPDSEDSETYTTPDSEDSEDSELIGFINMFSKKITESFTNEKEIDFNKITPILKNSTPMKLYNYNKNSNIYTFTVKNNNPLFNNKLEPSLHLKSTPIEKYTGITNNVNIDINDYIPNGVNNVVSTTMNYTISDTSVYTNSDQNSDQNSDIASNIIKNLLQIDNNNNLPNGIVFGPLEEISNPRCLSNEDSPAITISLTCGKNPEDAPTRFVLYGLADWNGSETTLKNFIKLIQVDNVKFSRPYQESSFVFENKNCFLTSYHITFFHEDGPKLITLNNIQLYYETDKCICCLGC